jgi:hypothetical protein
VIVTRIRRSVRQQEGQVMPALLLAVVITTFAAVLLFTVGEAADQSSRAETASDAAALGAAQTFARDVPGQVVASFVQGLGLAQACAAVPGQEAAARDYTRANGSDLVGFRCEPEGGAHWRFTAQTRARDTVRDSNSGRVVRSESRSAAELELTGICGSGTGIDFSGGCLTFELFELLCAPEPTASPTGSPAPTGTPGPLPPWLDGEPCPATGDLVDRLDSQVRLIPANT